MRKKIGIIYIDKIFVLTIFSIFLYIFLFYNIFSFDVSTMPFSCIHGCMASFLVIKLFHVLNDRNKEFKLSAIPIIMVSVYFMFSTIKYSIESVGINLVENNNWRLLGSFIVFVAELLAIYIWENISQKRAAIKIYKVYSGFITYLITIAFFVFQISTSVVNQRNIYSKNRIYTTEIVIFSVIFDMITYFVLYVVVLYFDKRKIHRCLPLIFYLFGLFLSSTSSGSRSIFVFGVLGSLFCLLYLNKIKMKYLFIIIWIAPIAYSLYSILVFYISGRDTGQSLAYNIAYRFDLADFPITILKNTSFLDFSRIKNEFLWGTKLIIPSFFMDKGKLFAVNEYKSTLGMAGLIQTYDYGDSYFSIGAITFGVFGMIFFFPFIIYLISKYEKQLEKKNRYVILFLFVQILINIEYNVSGMLNKFRTYIMSILFFSIINFIFIRLRIKK